jgi:hypothetical protein
LEHAGLIPGKVEVSTGVLAAIGLVAVSTVVAEALTGEQQRTTAPSEQTGHLVAMLDILGRRPEGPQDRPQ